MPDKKRPLQGNAGKYTPPHNPCGAKKKNGDLCKLAAGYGTEHPGYGNCKFHLGSTPAHNEAAKRQQALVAVENYGLPREIDPHAALLEELHRTAGHVAWLGSVIGDLKKDELYGPVGGSEHGFPSQQPHVWLRLYAEERGHFAKIAKTCIDVGIEERRVEIAEQQGILLATVLQGVLGDLGIDTDAKETREVVRNHLSLVGGTEAA